jgi:ribosomal-protein-serine acetyltransferase
MSATAMSAPLPIALPGGEHLRLLEHADAQELHALFAANHAHLERWMAWSPSQTLAQTEDFIEQARKQLADNNGFQAAIVRDERIVGVVGLHGVDWSNRNTSIGYWLAQSAQGRGTMTAAVRALIEVAFGDWRLNRVEIRLDVENERSRALAERLGFQREGTLRQAMLLAGAFRDDAVYSLLACEWPRRQRARSPGCAGAGEGIR